MAVWVGLIALAGVAAEIAVVLLVYLDETYERHRRDARLRSRGELFEAVREGAGERVRPVLMTATAVMAGLLPLLWGGGTGSTVMKRIAAPMVGGMVSATLLTLLVVPAPYSFWREWQLRAVWAEAAEAAPEAKQPVPLPGGPGIDDRKPGGRVLNMRSAGPSARGQACHCPAELDVLGRR